MDAICAELSCAFAAILAHGKGACVSARVLLELEAESSLRAQILPLPLRTQIWPLPQNRAHRHCRCLRIAYRNCMCMSAYILRRLTPGLFACRQMTFRLRCTRGSLDSSTFRSVIGPVREPWSGNFQERERELTKNRRLVSSLDATDCCINICPSILSPQPTFPPTLQPTNSRPRRKVLYGNQKVHNIRYLLQGTKSTSRLEVAVRVFSCKPNLSPFFEPQSRQLSHALQRPACVFLAAVHLHFFSLSVSLPSFLSPSLSPTLPDTGANRVGG